MLGILREGFVFLSYLNQKGLEPNVLAIFNRKQYVSQLARGDNAPRHWHGVLRLFILLKPKSTDAFASVLFGLVGQQGLEPRTNRL